MATTTRYPGHAPVVPEPGAAGHGGHAKVAPGEIAVGSSSDGPPNTSTSSSSASPACWSFRACSSRSSRRSGHALVLRHLQLRLHRAAHRHRAVHGHPAPLGRATKLTAALFLLGTATVGMAFLPGYDVIGMHAITLLAVFRCLQGLALGGSWDGLPSLLALNAPPQRVVRDAGPAGRAHRLHGRQRAVPVPASDAYPGRFPGMGLALSLLRGLRH